GSAPQNIGPNSLFTPTAPPPPAEELTGWERDSRARFEQRFVEPALREIQARPWQTAEAVGNRAFQNLSINSPIATAADVLREQVAGGAVQIAWDEQGYPRYAPVGAAVPQELATKAEIDAAGGQFPKRDQVSEIAEPAQEHVRKQVLAHLDGLHGDAIDLRALRAVLGHPAVNQEDPQANVVNQAVKELRDSGKIHVTRPRWGEPQVSKLVLPDSSDAWSSYQPPSELAGPEVIHLMRKHKVSLKDLAARMQITKTRIQKVREQGVAGRHTVRDWLEAIARPPLEGEPFTLADHKAFRAKAQEGSFSAAEWKIAFERMLASRAEFMAELKQTYNAAQLKNLAGNLGDFGASQNTKTENARSAYRSLLTFFHVGESYQFDPLRETHEAALAREVRGITQESLDAYFAERGVQREAHEKATTQPETLAEFRTFERVRGEAQLSVDQATRYDTLQAEQSRARRAAHRKSTVEQIQSALAENLEFTILEGFHSKRQCPVWIVQLSTRVERNTFAELKSKAQQLGGWWSSFVKAQAGFQFFDQATAKKFAGLLTADADRAKELAAGKEHKEQTASQRLTRLANDLHVRAEESLAQSSGALQNTARRADIQAGVRGRAYRDQAMARTVTRVAAALETGAATFLDGVRQKTHVEALKTVLQLAKWARVQEIQKTQRENEYADGMRVQEEEEQPYSSDDVRFAKYPYPTLYKRHLEEAVTATSRAKGLKLAGQRMRKRIQREKEDFVKFATDGDVEQLADFLARVKRAGHDTEWMDHELYNYKRLRAANIDSLPELRCALRELLPHLSVIEGDDPVTIAERELVGKDLPGFFPTPQSLVERLVEEAGLQSHHRVLEPSCGKGDIALAIRRAAPEAHVTCVEMNRTLGDVLAAQGLDPVFGDFLQFHDPAGFDRVLMNPPFERGADIDHVKHAYELLRPGGRLLAIMSAGPFFRSDKKSEHFRAWLEEVAGVSEQLPEVSFRGVDAFRHTGVRTRLVTIDKED
ncbi:class I SAM-dependent methyltransferase, partial [Pirellulales bacterium]|nr:class I SAM-dependent methyltransferase [Pirellulales bacterium]